jgi:hypothetical protein
MIIHTQLDSLAIALITIPNIATRPVTIGVALRVAFVGAG